MIDGPVAVGATLGHPHLAAVEQVQCRFHGVAHRAARSGVDGIAVVKGGIDRLRQGGEVVVRHRNSLKFGGYPGKALLHNSANRNRFKDKIKQQHDLRLRVFPAGWSHVAPEAVPEKLNRFSARPSRQGLASSDDSGIRGIHDR
ncbi:hypothetical protein D3C86_1613520 [compost metagenome]